MMQYMNKILVDKCQNFIGWLYNVNNMTWYNGCIQWFLVLGEALEP